MAKTPAILGVHLLDAKLGPVKIGTLTRDTDGAVAFTVSEAYMREAARPTLSLGWHDPTSDTGTRARSARFG
ncbi:hypothetical protein FIM10_17860 [Sphingomonadales bacterium 56]|uniref:hypothetical protein n=1 Tax=unclassified Sphingobium TaxID=2611147 RepID=UPI00191943EF|nr:MULTISPECIES: hypothetical protein [unclassified Sphingobium]MBY2930548.1 hypothetical protein [Sphingomonadales bacterium 56]MBY2960972.1 hypothetical protein [Sphingomonadales bacterium 58]CAD7341529.1 hypothetical protein SPHS6_03597 [Sphingobium sp. S6]CAD7342270.1 hypothetical protein SPHS8_03959 [Sphingobium sp. S8]